MGECSGYWEAKIMDGKQIKEALYFESKEERDAFVSSHPQWKKRGLFMPENLEYHLKKVPGSRVIAAGQKVEL